VKTRFFAFAGAPAGITSPGLSFLLVSATLLLESDAFRPVASAWVFGVMVRQAL
jgi:hypothetical protein